MGIKKEIIGKEVYECELQLCKQLSKNGGCSWGICKNCGVILLLHKLYKGELLEDVVEVNNKRKEIIS